MLGDGVDQFINNKLPDAPSKLRSVPHAMVMPSPVSPGQVWRAWYGRMFLAPSDAVDEQSGLTYGEVRQRMIEDSVGGSGGTGVGCSRRLLAEDPGCAGNQMWCWHRCMNYTAEASPEVCESENLLLQCASQRDQIWRIGIDGHGKGPRRSLGRQTTWHALMFRLRVALRL